MKKLKRLLASALSLCVIGTSSFVPSSDDYTVTAASSNVVEYLDRGISAVNTGSGMLVNWRYLANDDASTVFNLYRDNTLIYTSKAGESTCYLDKSGSASSSYRVDTLVNNKVTSSETSRLTSNNSYFDIPMDLPGSSYSPNDCSVGDVDGDGQYELFVKWDPSNSKDNSQKGKTDKVYIDCYRLDGTKLWRIDLGVNIRAGAHYTQFFVADFDLDGKCEMTCKTADGTIDGTGKAIGDASAVYRNGDGLIITGPEYYTLFDGLTGAALDTVDFEVGRGDVTKWGKSSDKFNRVDRFWGCVAYLDGVTPHVVSGRGYYGRMTATAYKVENKKLVKQWIFDTGTSSSSAGYGDGNHNSMPADVDGDGRQEIITGSTCIDDNGKLLWNTNQGHGDAMHVGDLLPDNPGIEIWTCHEDKPYGGTLIDGDTGKKIFHVDADGDTGRCCADNVWSGNDGAEFWFGNTTFDGSGNTLSCRRPSINFLSYWDGDLEREILDGYTDSPATITDMGADGKLTTILSTDGYYTCNTTKGTPCLSADIFGDWREELIVRAADGKSVRIYATTYDTDYRITTLMHDPHYRNQVAAQNVAYNQPPHLSYYLGSEKAIPSSPSVTVNSSSGTVVPPTPSITVATLTEGGVYLIKNKNSGMYLSVDGNAADNANVIQSSDNTSNGSLWRAIASPKAGYYYMYSLLDDGVTYCLNLANGSTENGANIEILKKNYKDAQQVMFVANEAGDAYTIRPRLANGTTGLGVSSGSKESGANVVSWELNGSADQEWILEATLHPGTVMDTSKAYMFKNTNSGLYMEVESGTAADNTNVQQWGANELSKHNSWYLKKAAYGYYYIVSRVGDENTYYLNISNGNAEILKNNGSTSHYFKFVKNLDGTYTILTRASRDVSALEIAEASTSSGANVLHGSLDYAIEQKWNAELFEITTVATTTTAVTTTTTTTTTAVTTTATTTKPDTAIKGDVNVDGKVESADIVQMKKYLVKLTKLTSEQFTRADMNGDGKVNVFDFMILKRNLI